MLVSIVANTDADVLAVPSTTMVEAFELDKILAETSVQ
jgi:hypothetical protein